ncbi:metallophosphoesterase [uncultured Bacteroides sp.]|uniref:metallophosphoesterase n=1 Tax=uncultured Bacteroides sp. TaxID=162156 RepID=UPI002AAC247E|nr:metallophosphoesterase [uncultured Bacteroides sp.]
MMQKLFLCLSLALILPDIFIYRFYISNLQISALAKYLYLLPSLLLLAGLIFLFYFTSHDEVIEKSRLIGWFVMTFFIFTLPKLTFTLISIFDIPLRYIFKQSFTPFTYIGVIAAVIWVGILLYGSLWGKTKFDVKQITYQSPLVPKGFDGYKIVQLSDIHIGSWQGNGKALLEAVELVNAQQPDLIVFTGDLINNKANELDGYEYTLSQLSAKDGVYSTLGNHDYGPYYKWKTPKDQANNLVSLKQKEAAMGWIMLNNEHRILHHEGDSIALIGVENWGAPPFTGNGDLKKAINGTEEIPFKLLLSHNPTHWKKKVLPESDVALMLSGHTHGMQLAFGNHSLSSLVYPQWGGLYTQHGRSLYVNVGLGFLGLPFRFGAWPEITVITLRSK